MNNPRRIQFPNGNVTECIYSVSGEKLRTIHRTAVNENGTLEQVTHYYPFDGMYGDAGLNASAQPYKYNGKELDRMYRLDWYDYGARAYDAVVPQFTTIDRYCEKYYNLSPYSHGADNPINVVDINGDSLRIMDLNLIMAICNGIKNKDVHLKFNNGVLDTNPIRKEAEKGDDFFIDDLFEISNSNKIIEMYATKISRRLGYDY